MVLGGFEICFVFVFLCSSVCFRNVWVLACAGALKTYICTKLPHDSTGLPYVKDRLLSCATKSLDRIAQNPPVEVSISRNRLNPAWDRFPSPLSVVRPGTPLV